MIRFLTLLLALLLAAPAASATDATLYFLVKGDPAKPDLCAYRTKAARDAAAEDGEAYDTVEVSRSGGVVRVHWTHITPSGDWMVEDRYRYEPVGAGQLDRTGGSATHGTRLTASYRWIAGKPVERTRFDIRDIDPPQAPSSNFFPQDLPVITRPERLSFWPLVGAMDVNADKARLCRPWEWPDAA